MTPRLPIAALLLLGIAPVAGCGPTDDDDATDAPDDDDDDGLTVGPEVTCAEPASGFDRFTDDAAARGVDHVGQASLGLEGCPWLPGIALADVDGDNHLDLVFSRERAFPHVYLNDGGGSFALAPDGPSVGGRLVLGVAVADADGDDIADVLLSGREYLLFARGAGDGTFADPEVVHERPGYPSSCYYALTVGDVDGDGDLDVAMGGLDELPDADTFPDPQGSVEPAADLLFGADAPGSWGAPVELVPASGNRGPTMMGTFTDRDGDGDQDLVMGTDRSVFPGSETMAWFRNDGGGVLVDDAPDVGTNLTIDAMGMGAADLNGDGVTDYCFTTVGGYLPCLFSLGTDGWFDGGLAAGLEPALDGFEGGGGPVVPWVSWGMVLEDFDNDGVLDLAVVAGPTPDNGSIGESTTPPDQPDAIWQGVSPGVFEERTADLGFGDVRASYGLAAGDLDGDGALEMVAARWSSEPTIWSNPCTSDAWVTVDVGPGGIGARVELNAGGRTRIREVYSALTSSQNPHQVHFGLGDADVVDRLVVTWPDGRSVEGTDLGVRRKIVAR